MAGEKDAIIALVMWMDILLSLKLAIYSIVVIHRMCHNILFIVRFWIGQRCHPIHVFILSVMWQRNYVHLIIKVWNRIAWTDELRNKKIMYMLCDCMLKLLWKKILPDCTVGKEANWWRICWKEEILSR